MKNRRIPSFFIFSPTKAKARSPEVSGATKRGEPPREEKKESNASTLSSFSPAAVGCALLARGACSVGARGPAVARAGCPLARSEGAARMLPFRATQRALRGHQRYAAPWLPVARRVKH